MVFLLAYTLVPFFHRQLFSLLSLRLALPSVPFLMENKPRKEPPGTPPPITPEQQRELEAKKKLSRPPKERTEVTIGPTDRSGPDVVLE